MNRPHNPRYDKGRKEEHKEEYPPYSRIFIVCDKRLGENDLTAAFERFGTIEDLYMPRDRETGASRGVAYIKYSKTSSAAKAIREMHLKTINNESKLVKVMIAANKNESSQNYSEDRYTRLFIKTSKETTESDLKSHFDLFGKVESVYLIKNKLTDENKGFAYIKYENFVDAAKAFEECDRTYKAVFAEPRDELKRSRNSLDTNFMPFGNLETFEPINDFRTDNNITSLITAKPQSYNSIIVNCSPQIPQKYLAQLFNIIPGMVQCNYSVDNYNGVCKATVTYEEEKAAAYAVERLNNFEFPSGELLSVKPNSNPLAKAANNLTDIVNSFKNGINTSNPDLTCLVEAIAQASNLIKVAATKSEVSDEPQKLNCNVDLPAPEPLASPSNEVAMRLFIVCKPQMPPVTTLKAIFSKFGDLIKICTFPSKTFGFVSYASRRSALQAIKVLDNAIMAGAKFRVMEAEEKRTADESLGMDVDEEHDTERKRMRLQET